MRLQRRYHRRVKLGSIWLAIVGGALLAACQSEPNATEASELARLMALPAGGTVAEVGAGDGRFTAALARRLGPKVRVVATELGRPNTVVLWKGLQAAAVNVTIIEGTATDTGLPPASCDAIVLRRTYHHFQQPAAMAASLSRALRPGARLFLLEQPLVLLNAAQKGVRGSRSSDGIIAARLIEELSAAGFRHERTVDPFSRQLYLVVMVRP